MTTKEQLATVKYMTRNSSRFARAALTISVLVANSNAYKGFLAAVTTPLSVMRRVYPHQYWR